MPIGGFFLGRSRRSHVPCISTCIQNAMSWNDCAKRWKKILLELHRIRGHKLMNADYMYFEGPNIILEFHFFYYYALYLFIQYVVRNDCKYGWEEVVLSEIEPQNSDEACQSSWNSHFGRSALQSASDPSTEAGRKT